MKFAILSKFLLDYLFIIDALIELLDHLRSVGNQRQRFSVAQVSSNFWLNNRFQQVIFNYNIICFLSLLSQIVIIVDLINNFIFSTDLQIHLHNTPGYMNKSFVY